jgi:hypothetical protein
MADIKEQLAVDPQESLRTVMDGHQAGLWTALPAIINGFDPVAMTVSCTPSIQAIVTDRKGAMSHVTISQLVDVPVCFPHGGGYLITFPIKAGDECLVVFSSRCIDGWWQSGQIAPQTDRRMHDLSDGFAIVGPYSQVRKPAVGASTTALEVRSEDDTLSVMMDHAAGTISMKAPVSVTVDTPLTHFTGNITNAGSIVSVGNVTAGAIDLETHHHTTGGGAGNTSGPIG